MKTRIFPRVFGGLMGVAILGQFGVAMAAEEAATNTTTTTTVTAKASPAPANPVQLSYGVADILKLSRAKVKDETILAFVANSQNNYNLSAEEIIYLRAEGVSERVVAGMLEHSKRREATVAAVAAPPAAPAQAATAYVPPANAYVATTPVVVQSSPVYVYSSPAYSYYDYYPYPYSYSYYGYRDYCYPRYGGYVGYSYPAVSLSFGFGSGYRSGGFRGGHHGGRR